MSSIAGVSGLVTGLPIQELVDSLIAIQRRPITLMENRVAALTQRRTAFLALSAQLLTIRTAAGRFGQESFFQSAKSASSDESSLLATVSADAALGSYTFSVRNLASTHQVIAAGFATVDSTPVGAGTLTIENAAGRVDRSTFLSSLNGGTGVAAGRIRITDQSGDAEEVDLTAARTIQDVLDAINTQSGIEVRARIDPTNGDRLILEDQSGGTGTLRVEEISGGQTAADLGLLGESATGSIVSHDLVFLASATRLDSLNDGNGVRRTDGTTDFRITLADGAAFDVNLSERLSDDTPLSILNSGSGVPAGSIRLTNRAGVTIDLDLSAAQTLGDMRTAIQAAGIDLTVTYNGAGLLIADASTGDGETQVEEISGGGTADALGILKTSETGSISGDAILSIQTIGDVVRIINTHADNAGGVIAGLSADGNGITLTDLTVGNPADFAVTALNGSGAADDLGLTGISGGVELNSRRLVAGLDTVLLRSLNGGSGVDRGVIELTNRTGATTAVDLTNAETLADVVAAINAETPTTSITASISSSGLGIELTDNSGGNGALVVSDLSGTTAADLNIAGSFNGPLVSSGNLQRQYISEATRLSSLNHGRGLPAGKFRITDSDGVTAVVDLTQGDEVTIQDVIDEINSRPTNITARINDTGDGILLTDTAGGGGQLKVTEEGGSVAAVLGILGEAAEGETILDGSFETKIEIDGNDTLNDVLQALQDSGAPINANIINDGNPDRPYRLNISSTVSGRAGELAIDAGSSNLDFDTLSRARDATVFFGDGSGGTPIVLSSATNSLSGVIEGVQLELVGASNGPVTITVTRDLDALTGGISSFVTAFNSTLSNIGDLTQFNAETETRGILLGDSTVSRIRSNLFDMITRVTPGLQQPYDRLSAIGITLASGGKSIRFDETKFREAFEENPAAVEALLATEDTGFADHVESEIDRLTDDDIGLISTKQQSLRDSEDNLTRRIDQLKVLLERRRTRLFDQFNATELAISRFQSQQASLLSLSTLLTG